MHLKLKRSPGPNISLRLQGQDGKLLTQDSLYQFTKLVIMKKFLRIFVCCKTVLLRLFFFWYSAQSKKVKRKLRGAMLRYRAAPLHE